MENKHNRFIVILIILFLLFVSKLRSQEFITMEVGTTMSDYRYETASFSTGFRFASIHEGNGIGFSLGWNGIIHNQTATELININLLYGVGELDKNFWIMAGSVYNTDLKSFRFTTTLHYQYPISNYINLSVSWTDIFGGTMVNQIQIGTTVNFKLKKGNRRSNARFF